MYLRKVLLEPEGDTSTYSPDLDVSGSPAFTAR